MRMMWMVALLVACGEGDDKDPTDGTTALDTETTDTETSDTETSDTGTTDTGPFDADGDGFVASEDCNDDDGTVYPGASDFVGDDVDQNCDGLDGVDGDADGSASQASGGLDCNDGDDAVHPMAADDDVDGVDQDCDGVDGVDGDGDSHASEASGGADCNDGDEDCDGVDGVDDDGDGYASEASGGVDCDDEDAVVYLGARDAVGDGIDQSCDGIDGLDGDRDGYASLGSGGEDCDDSDAATYPLAYDPWYDGIDQDCAGNCDWDQDGDGALELTAVVSDDDLCDTAAGPGVRWTDDCNDLDPSVAFSPLDERYPEPGAVEVSVLAPVYVVLDDGDPTAALTVEGPTGPVAGTVRSEADGELLIFEPDAPLDPGTTYTATLDESACGGITWTFETGGDPVSVVLDGSTYVVELDSGRWVEPFDVGELLGGIVDDSLLIGVPSAGPGGIELVVAGHDSGGQDRCVVTADLGTTWSEPDFTGDVAGPVAGGDWLLATDVALTGSFSSDGSTIYGMTLQAEIDTRAMVDAIGGGTDDSVCTLLWSLSADAVCEECSDGTGAFCVDVYAVDVTAELLPGVSVFDRTEADILADPACP